MSHRFIWNIQEGTAAFSAKYFFSKIIRLFFAFAKAALQSNLQHNLESRHFYLFKKYIAVFCMVKILKYFTRLKFFPSYMCG